MVKNPPSNAGDLSSILGLGRSPGEINGNPLQYSCLGDPTDRGAWQATVYGVSKNQIYNPSGVIQCQDLQTPFLIKKKIEGLLRP